jgi:hypothetical protein
MPEFGLSGNAKSGVEALVSIVTVINEVEIAVSHLRCTNKTLVSGLGLLYSKSGIRAAEYAVRLLPAVNLSDQHSRRILIPKVCQLRREPFGHHEA